MSIDYYYEYRAEYSVFLTITNNLSHNIIYIVFRFNYSFMALSLKYCPVVAR